MLPDQIAKFWPLIGAGITRSLPPMAGESPDKINRILENMLTGEMQCWAAFRKEDTVEVIGFVTTGVTFDYCSRTRNLLLYTIYGLKKTRASDWIEGAEALFKFAKVMKCDRIVGYTMFDNLKELAKKFGADTRYTFISIPINSVSYETKE